MSNEITNTGAVRVGTTIDGQQHCTACGGPAFVKVLRNSILFQRLRLRYGSIKKKTGNYFYLCKSCYFDGEWLVRTYSYDPVFYYYTEHQFAPLEMRYNGTPFRCARILPDVSFLNTLFMGVELEVEKETKVPDDRNWSEILCELPEFVYFKYDASLRHGIEIISHPMTLKAHKLQFEGWNKVFNLHKFCSAFFNKTCDMHVHLSKAAFTTLHLYKFMYFFYKHRNFIRFISQKTADNSNKLRTRKMLSAHPCDLREKAIKRYNEREDRYTAINLNREKTIEVRIFKSTFSSFIFYKNLEFCQALYNFTAIHNIKDSSNLTKFRNYISFNKKEYPCLFEYMNMRLPELRLKIWKAES